MINRLTRCLLLLVALCLSVDGAGQVQQAGSVGTSFTLQSAALGEQREYLVSLPESYENDKLYVQKRYPVAILLDADSHFGYVSGLVHFLSTADVEKIPEMIVVAVRNTNRTRDMTQALQGDADAFGRFLEQELLPRIDQQYRTLPYRVLIGHSLAGLFAVNCFLDRRPFNAYIALDPTLTWRDGVLLKKAQTTVAVSNQFRARVYVAQANNPFQPGESTGVRGRAFTEFKALLTQSPSAQLAFRHDFYPNETHFSVPLPGIQAGLAFVFDGYEFPYAVALSAGGEGVKRHYQQLAGQLGVDLLPPGRVINQASLFLLHAEKQPDKAIDLLRVNETYYPTSVVTHNSLGDAYRAKRDTATALTHYKKAQALMPTDEKSKQAIQELTKLNGK